MAENLENETENEDSEQADLEKELFETKDHLQRRERELATAKAKIEEYEGKIVQFREFVKKMEAEVKAIKERAARDQQKEIDQKLTRFLSDFLPVVDNLERSLKSVEAQDDDFVGGIRLIEKQMEEILRQNEVQKQTSKGEDFDPEIHEALTTVPVDDPEQDGKIIEVVKEVYRYKDQILRPAQVVVGQAREA